MKIEKDAPRHAFELMDAFRAGAAGIVAVSHVRDLMMQDYAGQSGTAAKLFFFITGFGHAGVVIFFVLSGFWITKSVNRRSDSPDFWRPYLIDRLTRLWLVLLPALVLGGLLDVIGSHVLHSTVYLGTSGAKSLTRPIDLSLPTLLANVAFLQTLVAPVFGSNGPLWSLTYEFWFYFWFPAILLTVRRQRLSWALLAFGVGIAFPDLLLGFVSWLTGSALFAVSEIVRRRGGVGRVVSWTVLVGGLIAFLVAAITIRRLPVPWMDPLLALGFAWLLLGICFVDPRVPGMARIARYGAHSSFSLYAIHYPVSALLAAVVTRGARLPATGVAAAVVLGMLLFLIGLGWTFSWLTEQRTAPVRRWLASRTAGRARLT